MWAFGVLLFLLLSGVHPFDNGEAEKVVNTRSANAEWTFTPEYWSAVSDDAKDLISKLLVVDPVARFTCDQAFAHPWISTHETVLASTQANLSKFLALRRLRAGVIAVKASLKMNKSMKSMRTLKSDKDMSISAGDDNADISSS